MARQIVDKTELKFKKNALETIRTALLNIEHEAFFWARFCVTVPVWDDTEQLQEGHGVCDCTSLG